MSTNDEALAEAANVAASRQERGALHVLRWLQFFDPGRYLAAAIGWAVVAAVSAAGFLAASAAADVAEREVREGSERLLSQLASQTQHTLSESLANRLTIVQATAAQIEATEDWTPKSLRQTLAAIQLQFPEFAWLGVADSNGKVVAATGGLLEQQDVSARPWFQEGAAGPWLGDVHKALLLEKHLPRPPDGQPLRFVDAAVPMRDGRGAQLVLGSHLSWHWVESLQKESLRALGSHQHIELMLIAGDGTVLTGPAQWVGRSVRQAGTDLTQGGEFLARQSRAVATAGQPGLDWSVVVRQRRDAALGAAADVERRVFVTVLAAAWVAAALSIGAALVLTRKLTRLAVQAQEVQNGSVRNIEPMTGRDEIARIGVTLAGTVALLQDEKAALQNLNRDLDARVVERTCEIARLAEENQRLALERERLRMARDVHDSLANSLLALLNEIRLMRMLQDRGQLQHFAARLEAAEQAAARGLAEARGSITQMRYNNLAQVGLAGALQDLLVRFGERTGVVCRFHAQQDLGIAQAQAEVVFRIAEEAIRNVERHAAARHLEVTMARLDDLAGASRLQLTIADDGVGFDPARGKEGHYGVQGLHEQAAMIQGCLQIDSQPGHGTRLTLSF